MKKLLNVGLVAFAAIFLMASCNTTTEEKVEEKADTFAERTEAKIDDVLDRDSLAKDKDFVKDATKESNRDLRRIIVVKRMGTSKDVKDAARKMENDHKKLDEDLKAYASKKNYEIDTANTDIAYDNEKKGADWDKKWVDDMVKEHEESVKEYEKAETEVTDPELRKIIVVSLPVLRKHLVMAKDLQTRMNQQ